MSLAKNKKNDDYAYDEDEAMPGSASVIDIEDDEPVRSSAKTPVKR